MEPDTARKLFSSRPVARMATIGPSGPHLVPVVFAVSGDEIVTVVDHKPKRTHRLQRLANITTDPRVTLLADHYEDDWSGLWWARADGTASIIEAGEAHSAAIDLLADKYAPYRGQRPNGPVISVAVARWSGWRASPRQ